MIYVLAYLAVGAVTLGVVLVAHRLTRPPQSDLVQAVLESLDPARSTLRHKLMYKVVAPALAGVLILVAWPGAVFIKVREMLAGRADESGNKPAPVVFCVSREDLVCEMTVDEIEAAEAVSDPLGAVPPLPFGHLNAAWSRFRSGLAQSDTIWRFASVWEGDWGRPEIREGYVIARGDDLGPYLLTARRVVERAGAGELEVTE